MRSTASRRCGCASTSAAGARAAEQRARRRDRRLPRLARSSTVCRDWRVGQARRCRGHYRPPEAHPTAWVEREVSSFLRRPRSATAPCSSSSRSRTPMLRYDPPEPYASMYDPATPSSPRRATRSTSSSRSCSSSRRQRRSPTPEAEDRQGLSRFLAVVRGLVQPDRRCDRSPRRAAAARHHPRVLHLGPRRLRRPSGLDAQEPQGAVRRPGPRAVRRRRR